MSIQVPSFKLQTHADNRGRSYRASEIPRPTVSRKDPVSCMCATESTGVEIAKVRGGSAWSVFRSFVYWTLPEINLRSVHYNPGGIKFGL